MMNDEHLKLQGCDVVLLWLQPIWPKFYRGRMHFTDLWSLLVLNCTLVVESYLGLGFRLPLPRPTHIFSPGVSPVVILFFWKDPSVKSFFLPNLAICQLQPFQSETCSSHASSLSQCLEYSTNPHKWTGVLGDQADFVLIHRLFSAKLAWKCS